MKRTSSKRYDNKNRVLKDNESQRKDGRYMYKYFDINHDIKYVYSWKLVSTDKIPSGKRNCKSLRELEQIINEKLSRHIDISAAQKSTLNDYFMKYINTKHKLKKSTMVNYKYMYNKFVRDTLGKRKIAEIKHTDICDFYASLLKEKGFQINSLDNIHTLLHPTFQKAVWDDVIYKNPADNIMGDIKKDNDTESRKRRALTIGEQTAFIDYVKNSTTYSHWMPIFKVLLGTGCRIGECLGLTWDDIDFKSGTISISHSLNYRPDENGRCTYSISTTKTKSGNRTIPMISDVRKALLTLKQIQFAKGYSASTIDGYKGFVFINRNGEVMNPASINRAINRIVAEYNRNEDSKYLQEKREPFYLPKFSAHSLRHTFCTRYCENESNIKVIQTIMGHCDISTTMNIYNEATQDKQKESMESLEGKIIIS